MTETTAPETDEKAPETDESGPDAAEQPATAPEGQPDAAEPPKPPEPQTVDEAAAEALSSTMVVHHETPAGSLTLRPNQKELDAEQHWALKAIGIDTQTDPGIIPHLRAFVHMCQIRGLDPFAREAYLIGRGKGDNRKYTMQTGIDGYRKMGAATGRFIRVKKRLWTGEDDDDRSYVLITDEDGDIIRQRVWYDQWPAGRGNPGAAKVVIEHYDEDDNVTTTASVADWAMYAPYNDLWEYDPQQRKRVQRFDENRQPIKVLGEMWAKGGPHMLAKCAEALAYRMAFPAKMSGVYITEEMHRLDGNERDRRQTDQQKARREALRQSREPQPAEDIVEAELVDEPKGDEPTKVDEVVAETASAIKVDAEEALRLLHAELVWQADVLGQGSRTLAKRAMMKSRRDLDEFTVDDLYPLVNGLRSMVVSAARTAGLDEAEAYAAVAVDGAGPIDVDNLGPEDALDFNPEEEHPFEDDGSGSGDCVHCGLAEDTGPHPEDEA